MASLFLPLFLSAAGGWIDHGDRDRGPSYVIEARVIMHRPLVVGSGSSRKVDIASPTVLPFLPRGEVHAENFDFVADYYY